MNIKISYMGENLTIHSANEYELYKTVDASINLFSNNLNYCFDNSVSALFYNSIDYIYGLTTSMFVLGMTDSIITQDSILSHIYNLNNFRKYESKRVWNCETCKFFQIVPDDPTHTKQCTCIEPDDLDYIASHPEFCYVIKED